MVNQKRKKTLQYMVCIILILSLFFKIALCYAESREVTIVELNYTKTNIEAFKGFVSVIMDMGDD